MKNTQQHGFVYILQAEGANRFKIGYSTNPQKRCQDIGQQSPFPIKLIHSYPSDDAYRDEQKLHNMFSSRRIYGEWFYFDSVEHVKVLINEFYEIKSVAQLTKPFSPTVSSFPENDTQLQHPNPKKRESPENNSNPNNINRHKFEAIVSYCQRKGTTTVRKIQQGKLLPDDYKLDSNSIKNTLDMLSDQGLISLDKSSEDWIVESLTGSSMSLPSPDSDTWEPKKTSENNTNLDDRFMQILAFCEGMGSASVRDVQRASVGRNLSSDDVKCAFEWLEKNEYGTVTSKPIGGVVRVVFSPSLDTVTPDTRQQIIKKDLLI